MRVTTSYKIPATRRIAVQERIRGGSNQYLLVTLTRWILPTRQTPAR
jgi:hypothetical protein